MKPAPPARSHVVELSRTDGYATTCIASFVHEGLQRGCEILVIATPARTAAVRRALRQLGVGVETALDSGELTFADAEDALASIVVDDHLDERRLAELFQPFVQRSARPKRIYGEMVSLLVARGLSETALALEAAGHELAHGVGVEILCGYEMSVLSAASPDVVARVIASHDAARMDVDEPEAAAVTVLLADDYEDTRDLFGEYLRFRGYRVVLASDGVEALERARAFRPDVLLLDVRMPRMTGTEVMQALKAEPFFATVPVVALTAHAFDDERTAMLNAGFDDVITKPCLPDALAATVASLARPRQRTLEASA